MLLNTLYKLGQTFTDNSFRINRKACKLTAIIWITSPNDKSYLFGPMLLTGPRLTVKLVKQAQYQSFPVVMDDAVEAASAAFKYIRVNLKGYSGEGAWETANASKRAPCAQSTQFKRTIQSTAMQNKSKQWTKNIIAKHRKCHSLRWQPWQCARHSLLSFQRIIWVLLKQHC